MVPAFALLPVIAALTLWNLFSPAPAGVSAAGLLTFIFILLQWQRLTPSLRRMCVALAVATCAALPFSPAPWESLQRGMAIGTLLASLVSSVSMLARVALRSRQVDVVAGWLLAQGSRQRYLSFSLAGQVFGGMLGLAGVNMLMNMAARDQESLEEDRISMFVAITRSFSAATLWSPMFSNTAILLVLYPGLTWIAVLPLALALAAAAVAIGQGLDLWRLRGRVIAPSPPAAESLRPVLLPLLGSMAGFLALVIGAALLLHIPVPGVIICLAPAAALLLHIRLAPPGHRGLGLKRFAEDVKSLPGMSGEITLFMLAGCGGTVLASAIPPAWIVAVGSAVSHQPILAVLMLMLTIVGLASLAVHPVLSAVLVASSFPPALLHLLPVSHLCAILVGWAVAGAFTPFSVVNLMASRYSGVPVLAISARANHMFAGLCLGLAALALGGVSLLSRTP